MEDIKRATLAVYRRSAEGYDRHRPRVLFEQTWLDRLVDRMGGAGSVLDLGCGTGDPIAGYLLGRGLAYTGLDYSEPMLAIARRRYRQYPAATWIEGDMRALSRDRRYRAVMSWDGSFHLDRDEQRGLLETVTEILEPGGSLLLTIGDRDGEVLGTVEGESVYHASLDPAEYLHRLTGLGFSGVEIVTRDASCDFHSVLLATRSE